VQVRPETLYTRSGDVSIAYQVTGDGPFDMVFIPPFVTHVELVWTTSFAPALRALSSFCRLIRFDKRGTGISDRVAGSGLAFEDRSTHELKGIPGEWHLYAVER
jgi:pimeloyl-ACP methyl ester carboxylesterase